MQPFTPALQGAVVPVAGSRVAENIGSWLGLCLDSNGYVLRVRKAATSLACCKCKIVMSISDRIVCTSSTSCSATRQFLGCQGVQFPGCG